MVIVIGAYLGFTKDIPFTRPFQLSAVFENAPPIQKGTAVRIAGVDVGKVSKVESLGRQLARREGDDEARGRGAADPQGRRGEGAASGSSSRATSSWTSSPAPRARTPWRTGTRSRPPRRLPRCSSTRCSARSTTNTRKDLQDLLVGFGDSLNGQPQPGEDDDQDPDVKGETAGRGAERLARLRARGAARRGDREPGHARQGGPRPVQADRRPAEGLRRARQPRGPAQGPDHELQHDGRGARHRAAEPRRDDPRAARRCSRPRSRLSTTSTPPSRPRARGRSR